MVLTFVPIWNTGLVACGRNSTLVGDFGKLLGELGVSCFAVSAARADLLSKLSVQMSVLA